MAKKQPKLTPWFPASVKPKRNGWYDTRTGSVFIVGRRYWNGSWWSAYWSDAVISQTQDWLWRGLAEKPQ